MTDNEDHNRRGVDLLPDVATSPRAIVAIGGLVGAALLVLVWAVGIPAIEDDLRSRSEAALDAAYGDAAEALAITFDGRSATVVGALPSGVSATDVGLLIGDLDGVRTVDVQLLGAPPSTTVPEQPIETSTLPPTTEATEPGIGHDITATFDGATVILAGTALSREEAADLRAIANAEVGLDAVTDDLLIGGRPNDESDARSDAFGAYFGLFTLGVEGAELRLTDDQITVSVDVATTTDGAAVQRIADTIAAPVPVDLVISAPPASLDEEISLLQAELDALRGEIAETVVFASGTAQLTAEAEATLDKVVAAMSDHLLPVVEVGGHTDNRGGAESNQQLSADRAAAVVAYLVTQGVADERVRSVGFGDTQPIGDNETADGRLENRRVELVALEGFAQEGDG